MLDTLTMDLSPYKISVFNQCRKRYQYHYVDNLIKQYKKDWPWLTMGTHIHDTLYELFDKFPPIERTYVRAETILRMKWARNRKGFKSSEEEKEYGLKALAQLKRFVETQSMDIQPFRLEKHHKALLEPSLLINGKIDRMDKLSDNSFHIIDYKTGEMDREPDDFQLLLYCLLISRNFTQPVSSASYMYLDSGALHTISPNTAQLEATAARIRGIATQIAAEKEFPPKTGQLCKFCDFSEICDATKA